MGRTIKYFALIAFMTAISGCSWAKDSYKEAGDAVGVAAKKTGEAIAKDAKAAEPKIKEAAAAAQKSAGQVLVTGKVRSALLAAPGLQSGHISVETVGKTVTISGNVPSAGQHKAAIELAKMSAGGDYKIVDRLAFPK